MIRGIVVDTTTGRVKAMSDMVGDDITGMRESDFGDNAQYLLVS